MKNSISLSDLSSTEKLQLVQDIWEDLASSSEEIPVHEWQKKELSRRRKNLMKDPASGLSWEEVKNRIKKRNGQ